MSERRVVISGIGLMTACGRGWRPYWSSVLEGRSQIREISGFNLNGGGVNYGGEIPDFNPLDFIKQKKSLKLMSREIQLAVAASHLAIEDANLLGKEIDRDRFGISLGVGIINNDLDEIGAGIKNACDENGKFLMTKFGKDGLRSLYPLWLLKYLPNMPACHVSIAHDLRGPSNTITTSSAASAQAIGEAFMIIKRSDADLMIAGGADSKINAMGISRFSLLGLLSQNQSIQESGYCPFDRKHDGIVLGEGAGLLVLEEFEHAKNRGAKIYGEVLGYGSSSDYNYDPRISEESGGKRHAMIHALGNAEISPSEVNFMVANGSGIPLDDVQEAVAVEHVFGSTVGKLRVTATKPITGHLNYGAGGVELASALLSLYEGVIPPVANLRSPDPACDLPFVQKEPEVSEAETFMFNSFGLCGQNASLIVSKVRD